MPAAVEISLRRKRRPLGRPLPVQPAQQAVDVFQQPSVASGQEQPAERTPLPGSLFQGSGQIRQITRQYGRAGRVCEIRGFFIRRKRAAVRRQKRILEAGSRTEPQKTAVGERDGAFDRREPSGLDSHPKRSRQQDMVDVVRCGRASVGLGIVPDMQHPPSRTRRGECVPEQSAGFKPAVVAGNEEPVVGRNAQIRQQAAHPVLRNIHVGDQEYGLPGIVQDAHQLRNGPSDRKKVALRVQLQLLQGCRVFRLQSGSGCDLFVPGVDVRAGKGPGNADAQIEKVFGHVPEKLSRSVFRQMENVFRIQDFPDQQRIEQVERDHVVCRSLFEDTVPGRTLREREAVRPACEIPVGSGILVNDLVTDPICPDSVSAGQDEFVHESLAEIADAHSGILPGGFTE